MPVILNKHLKTYASTVSSKADSLPISLAEPQASPTRSLLFTATFPGNKVTSQVRSPVAQNALDPWCRDLPIGADYPTILAYFVAKGRPTYRFADLPAEMACVALACYIVAIVPVPAVYLYLDDSLLPQYWYYVYRYILYGYSESAPAALQQVAVVPNSPGAMTLILADKTQSPALSCFGANLPAPWATPNPHLAQVSLGNAPIAYAL